MREEGINGQKWLFTTSSFLYGFLAQLGLERTAHNRLVLGSNPRESISRKENVMGKLESEFQSKLIKDLKAMFPGCIVMKNDSSYIQGIPDLLILYKDRWAALECKKNASASRRPNQDYYVDIMDRMSFARFIFPENREDVLDELYQAFEPRRTSRSI